MLVTENVIDRIAFRFIIKELRLNEQLTMVFSFQDAINSIEELQNEDPTGMKGYALVLLDISEDNFNFNSVKRRVKSLKQNL